MFLTTIARARAKAPHVDRRETAQAILAGYGALGVSAGVLTTGTLGLAAFGVTIHAAWAAVVALIVVVGLAALVDALAYLNESLAETGRRNHNPGEIITIDSTGQAGVSC
jgi:hypothetical protein